MREYELEVLEQYDIEVISTRKTRGAYALISGIQTRNEGGHTHLYEGGKTL